MPGLPVITLLLLLSLVTYRVTRFIIADTLIDHQRIWVLNVLLGKAPGKVRNKLHELLTCKFCLSVWIAAAVVVIADQFTVIPLPWFVWLAVCSGSLLVWKVAEPYEVEVSVANTVRHREEKYSPR